MKRRTFIKTAIGAIAAAAGLRPRAAAPEQFVLKQYADGLTRIHTFERSLGPDPELVIEAVQFGTGIPDSARYFFSETVDLQAQHEVRFRAELRPASFEGVAIAPRVAELHVEVGATDNLRSLANL